nr:hypothetical protein [Tanacetum cinerariifolium]
MFLTEISSAGDFMTTFPSYTTIREPLKRLCHCLIAFTIVRRGQAPEKVTTTDLYYLRNIDEGTVSVPYMLAHNLVRHVEGMKKGARMSGGYFVTRLAEHFRLITKESLRGLTVVIRDLIMIDIDEADQEILEEGVQADPAPVQAPQAPLTAPTPRTMPQRMARLKEEPTGAGCLLGSDVGSWGSSGVWWSGAEK